MEYRPIFEPNALYHLYNHANGNENLYRNSENYFYFLKKIQKYLLPIADIYAYCLMPNHFHFLVQIKSMEELLTFYNKKHKDQPKVELEEFLNWDSKSISTIVSQQLSNMLNGYAQALNKEHKRAGSLFRPRIKRKKVACKNYRNTLLIYIHRNPIHHGFVNDFGGWRHSSYHNFFNDSNLVQIDTEKVKNWYENPVALKELHQSKLEDFILAEFDN